MLFILFKYNIFTTIMIREHHNNVEYKYEGYCRSKCNDVFPILCKVLSRRRAMINAVDKLRPEEERDEVRREREER